MTLRSANGLPAFIEQAMALKHVLRQGWIDRGVASVESVADHSWSVAVLAWFLAAERDELDRQRVLLLGLMHDLPESQAGDTTPLDEHRDSQGRIDPEHFTAAARYSHLAGDEKRQREISALEQMLRGVSPDAAREISEAWHEYDQGESAEARFVKHVDKLETVIQAVRYRRDQPEIIIGSFIAGARRDVTDPQLVQLLETFLAGE
jgi:putative hydrolases of HD superfamily